MPKGKSRHRYPELYVDLNVRKTDTRPSQVHTHDEFGTAELVGGEQPDIELTSEQQRVREQEAQHAQAEGKTETAPVYETPTSGEDNIVIHVLEDGFTVLGNVWFRGQEMEFSPNGPAYRDTFDRNGRSWLELRDKDFAQVERWGKIMFRSGPWPGKSLLEAEEVSFDQLRSLKNDGTYVPSPSKQELSAAAAAEAKRGRAAPRLPLR